MTTLGYARVSTTDQNTDGQLDALNDAGCERIFTDRCSGKLARRPKLDALLEYARPGDVVVITKLDRLGRSLRHLLDLVADFAERGIDLRVIHQAIDTTGPTGKLTFAILGAVAEFERDMISERTHEGLAAARARGRKGGRPSALSQAKVQHARKLRDSGEHTMAEIAELVGCSRATLYRALDKDPAAVATPKPAKPKPAKPKPVVEEPVVGPSFVPNPKNPSPKMARIAAEMARRLAAGETEGMTLPEERSRDRRPRKPRA